MKIEIVPEEKKTTRTKKEAGGADWLFQWVFDTVFGSVHTFVEGVTKSVVDGVDEIAGRVAQKAVLAALISFGFFFLLQGMARILDVIYEFPGMGETVVGFLVLAAALIFSVAWKKQ